MQTVLKVTVNPSSRDPWESYGEELLKIMLTNGAKVIHVTPILGTKACDGTYVKSTYTESLSYVIEEPDSEEYKKIIREQSTELHNRIEERIRRMSRY